MNILMCSQGVLISRLLANQHAEQGQKLCCSSVASTFTRGAIIKYNKAAAAAPPAPLYQFMTFTHLWQGSGALVGWLAGWWVLRYVTL